jgi:putative GTP pyrophosphokinase
VKDCEHVLEKIIRKRLRDPRRAITAEHFDSQIKDLIGVRVLHLFKEDWSAIHDFITHRWTPVKTPLAYYREGDAPALLAAYQEAGCILKQHVHGYRSVHYLIEGSAAPLASHVVEIQVRTLFEEAWSEIDHFIRYPYEQDYPLLAPHLVTFNRLAGSADEMASYVRGLQSELKRLAQDQLELLSAHEATLAKLERTIQELRIGRKEMTALQFEVHRLRQQVLLNKSLIPAAGPPAGGMKKESSRDDDSKSLDQ